MRKGTVRAGMRIILSALILIMLASFYHAGVARLLSLAPDSALTLYGQVVVISLITGILGVIMAVAGLIKSPGRHDYKIKIYPLFLLLVGVVLFYIYMMVYSGVPEFEDDPPLKPGETVTI